MFTCEAIQGLELLQADPGQCSIRAAPSGLKALIPPPTDPPPRPLRAATAMSPVEADTSRNWLLHLSARYISPAESGAVALDPCGLADAAVAGVGAVVDVVGGHRLSELSVPGVGDFVDAVAVGLGVYRLPDAAVTESGLDRSDWVATLLLLPPQELDSRPATVYSSPPSIEMPHWALGDLGTPPPCNYRCQRDSRCC